VPPLCPVIKQGFPVLIGFSCRQDVPSGPSVFSLAHKPAQRTLPREPSRPSERRGRRLLPPSARDRCRFRSGFPVTA
jgi:hypothetical protein